MLSCCLIGLPGCFGRLVGWLVGWSVGRLVSLVYWAALCVGVGMEEEEEEEEWTIGVAWSLCRD